MPFTIQSDDVAAVPARQSIWYDVDIAILVAGLAGTGVLTGCAVTAQGTPAMTLAVAAGTIQPSAGVAAVTVTGGNVTITAADGTHPRIDLVSASAAGVKTVTAGTPATDPKPPALPSGSIALAMVDVPAADTAIETAQITDKRAMVVAPAIIWSSGTSMPGSPVTGQRITRTDLGMDFSFDGTRWLSTTLYREPIGHGETAQGTATAGVYLRGRAGWSPTFSDVWITTIYCWTLVTGTNDGSHFYTMTVYGGSSLGSFTTAADTVGTGTTHNIAVNALLGTNYEYEVSVGKTSTPGNCFVEASVAYRIVGT